MTNKYYLSATIAGETFEREVDLEEYLQAQRASLYVPASLPSDFTALGGISGRIELAPYLAPCPHCGNGDAPKVLSTTDARWFNEADDVEHWTVCCDASSKNKNLGCGAHGGFADTVETAIAKWNRRTPS